MQLRALKIMIFSVITVLAAAQNSFAAGSGGIRVELPDSEAFGKGSAFVGEADNPSAVYYNPAGLTQLPEGNHISGGFSILAPSVSYTDFAGNETQMTRQNFKLPHFYFVSDFGVDNWAFGVGGVSSWGLGTSFAEDSFARYNATDADITMIDSMLTAAYKFNDQLSFALGVNSVYSTVNKAKKLAQGGLADGDFNLKGKDTAWGYRLATHYKMNEHHRFGLMYRSPLPLKYRGKAFLHELNAGAGYSAIFGDDHFETNFAQELELPQSVALGYSFQPDNKWTFNFDIEWFDWSSVEYDLVEWTEVLTVNQAAVLNAGNPSDRDWKSVWSAGLGLEYAWSDDFRLRGGYYYHTTPIPDENIDSSLPDANKHGITTGFGFDVTDNSTVDLAYSYLVYENFTLDNAVGSTFGANLDGKYEQIMHMGLVTFTYDF
ncbi:MAG: hypothetical protein A3C36_05555 [Omnitrophica WOR_2 bacterium RIFCSPHIGHO2_02_FULL_52_10]|nr:MAG: hypothetical protein A3C36_05555 [Omnitrophica WOR_2 bacterium RIFCSPHIGHO2_02_FULL_52_10]